jgi:multidrug transporter EmrE-like cation transporter
MMVVVAASAAFLLVSMPAGAEAQEVTCDMVPDPDGGNECVDADGKGMVGLGLIGAELGFLIPALAGLDETWAYIVFPVIGAVGGALAGYFLLDEPNHPEVAIATLAVGLAAIIPTMVLTLTLTAYDPEDEEAVQRMEDDEAPVGPDPDEEMMQETAPAGGASPAGASHRGIGSGLVRLNQGGVYLGVPAVAVAPNLTADEAFRYGGSQTAELQVPVLSGTF